MNALFGLLAWLLGMMNPTHPTADAAPGHVFEAENPVDANDIHIININPRTVVALEDTHFRPSR